MRFHKYGQTFQLEVQNAQDLETVLALNEGHWVATSAPVSAFRTDPRFTQYVDHDANGRIRTDEVRAAIAWFLDLLDDRTRIADDIDALPLSAIRAQNPAGATLVASAQYVLRLCDKADSDTISLDDVRRFLDDIAKQPLNGDGVIVPAAAEDPAAAGFIRDAAACVQGTEDASGKTGITLDQLDAFQKGVEEYLAWKERGQAAQGPDTNGILTLGEQTAPLYGIVQKHAAEVDAFFALCRTVHFEPAAADRLTFPAPGSDDPALTDMAALQACLAALPLARPTEDSCLPLGGQQINPLYREWVEALRDTVLPAVLDCTPQRLSESDWKKVRETFAPYEAYLGEKTGAAVEKLAPETLAAYRDGALADTVRGLIEEDKRIGSILNDARQVEKLLLFHKYLLRLVNNFVNFSELYNTAQRALFETGSAVIDGRWFNMALRVDDVKTHSAVAKNSNLFTVYLEVTGRPDGKADAAFHVALPATAGTKGNLAVGKRGIFLDTDGVEYDARVVQLIENPISLREALCAPLVRLWNFMVGKIEAMSSASEKDLQKTTDTLMKGPSDATPAAPGAMGPAGLLVGMSVSVAAIGSAFAFISKTLASMTWAARLFSLLGAFLVVVVPVSLLAVLKLSRQDLSALLEGCGWGINARMRLNRALRRQFTQRPPYPDGARGTPTRGWVRLLIWLAVIAAAGIAAYTIPRLLIR